jgi:hypothetical protein
MPSADTIQLRRKVFLPLVHRDTALDDGAVGFFIDRSHALANEPAAHPAS